MPLTRAQRTMLTRVLRWSRSAGWQHDVYPNTWRSRDGSVHIRYDTAEQMLVVDRMNPGQDPLRCRVALIPVESPDEALRVLAALGHIPDDLDEPPADLRQLITAAKQAAAGWDRWDSNPAPSDTGTGDAADTFDGPASFAEAGQAFADLVDGRVMPDRAAEALSQLARAGLIVSVAYHDEMTSEAAGDTAMADVLPYPTSMLGVHR